MAGRHWAVIWLSMIATRLRECGEFQRADPFELFATRSRP
jgi:hypothetical protein